MRKRRFLGERDPGSNVAQVAQRYDVSRGLIWTWRHKAMDTLAVETAPDFIPLRIASESAEGAALTSAAPAFARQRR
jgi:transposase